MADDSNHDDHAELFRTLECGPDGQPGGILITSVGQEVVPGIWIGGYKALESESFLQKNGITRILSLGHFKPRSLPEAWINKIIPIADHREANIIRTFPETFDFIDQALETGQRVLVHCLAGVSRSPTIVAAYLMKKEQLRPKEALARIRQTRHFINPNPGFLDQLRLYYEMHCHFDPRDPCYLAYLGKHPHDKSHAGHDLGQP